MYEAYVRIFRRCGLRAKVVEADTGAMGGQSMEEFVMLVTGVASWMSSLAGRGRS